MALYYGKSIDMFEGAFKMLFSHFGLPQVGHLDVFALRTCCYQFSEQVHEWFTPMIPDEQAVRTMFCNYGMTDSLLAGRGEEMALDMLEGGAVICGCKKSFGPSRFHEKYYRRNSGYLFCHGSDCGYYILSNPDGFPYCLVECGVLRDMILRENWLVCSIKKGSAVSVDTGRQSDIIGYDVVSQNLAYRKRMQHEPEAMSAFDFDSIYKDSASSRCALSYGISNYLIQTCKLIDFMFPDIGPDSPGGRRFVDLFCEFNRLRNGVQISAIRELDDRLWELLLEQWEGG